MKRLLILPLLLFAGLAMAQPVQDLKPIRIKVRHADPWFVKAMLEGQPMLSPEVSTLFNFMGLPSGAANMIDKMFEGGTFIVNAADNSIWWIPTKKQ